MALGVRPSIFQRRSVASPDIAEELGISVPAWSEVLRMKCRSGALRAEGALDPVRPQGLRHPMPYVLCHNTGHSL